MIALTFLCGFVIEAVAVFWTHFSERGRAWQAALFSVLQASALLSLSVCNTWPLRAAFVFGYALGSVVAVKVKERIKWNTMEVTVRARPHAVKLVHPEAFKNMEVA